MNPRDSQLMARLLGCERLLEHYRQELARLRAQVEKVTQARAQAQASKAVVT